MFCPFCGGEETKVVDKRDNRETGVTRRRRECLNCTKRFTTYERVENIILTVRKRDDTTEEFNREKLKTGILKAVKKRPIAEDDVDELIKKIERELMNSDTNEIDTVSIGEMVLRELTQIDKLGALLFAAVYREFKDLEDVEQELSRLSS